MNRMDEGITLNTARVEDQSSTHSITFIDYVWIIAGISAITGIIYQYHIEQSLGLIRIMPIVLAGFTVHAIAPIKWRPPLFFTMTIIGILTILGIKDGSLLIVLGLMLFFLANLKVNNTLKYTLLIIFSGCLAIARLGWIEWFDKPDVLTILGALFMFRLIVYLYEINIGDKNENIWQKLNYFFLLPNLVFFIFPVVDYKTFTQNFYRKKAFSTYQKGIVWMANGVLHLLMYRIIYYYIIPSPNSVDDPISLVYFAATSYALIVRLAGIFHFSAGVLCLFGFDLPATFRHYFFAHNFNDLWRRINVYWRDFMIKVFYYPIYFKIKHIGIVKAIIVSILIVFAINWFLHAYQWFWIRGIFPITIQDMVFWSVFGLGVAVNSAVQASRSRQPINNQPGFDWSAALKKSFNVIGVFLFISLIWSFWTTEQISTWLSMVNVALSSEVSKYFLLAIAIGIVAVLGVGFQWLLHYLSERQSNPFESAYSAKFLPALSGILLMLTISLPSSVSVIQGKTGVNMDPIFHTRLNETDRERQFKGYYETLLPSPQHMDTPLDQLHDNRPDDWKSLEELGGMNKEDNILLKSLKPNINLTFKRAPFSTNKYGMRGPDISQKPNEQKLRFALLGGSIELGPGVSYEETFPYIWQEGLNTKLTDKHEVEILNFAVPSYHITEQVYLMRNKVMDFNPDVIIYTAHSREQLRTIRGLYPKFNAGYHKDDDWIYQFIISANIEQGVDKLIFEQKLQPKADELMKWGLQNIYDIGSENNAKMVLLYVPNGMDKNIPGEKEKLIKIARNVGFDIVDLTTYYETINEIDVILAPWDNHLSQKAHNVYGNGLIEESLNTPETFKLDSILIAQ